MKQTMTLLALVVLLAALPVQAASVDTGLADFSTYVAIGDSLTAGFASGGLAVEYQEGSYPALIAQQLGLEDFQQPLVSMPGIPPVLVLQHLVPSPVIVPSSDTPGMPMNAELPRPYNNIAVPGANLYDLLNTTGDIMNLLAGNTDNVMHDLILRDGVHTQLEQAIGLGPTFATMWIGSNDILGAAVYATPVEGVTMTPVDSFAAMYPQALGALIQYTGADVVVITVPHVTVIPFVTTIEPYITLPDGSHVPLIGSNGPLTEDCYVTLAASQLLAQGIGIPVELGGTGQPLPEDLQFIGGQVVPGVVLRPEEVQIINGRVDAFNQIIEDTAAALGAKVLDINPFLERVKNGFFVYGGFQLSTQFLLGGVFSYDGVHPQKVGYALVANELINLINHEFRADIPQVNLYDILVAPAYDGDSGGDAAAMSADPARVFTDSAMKELEKAFPLLGPLNTGREVTAGGQIAPNPRLEPRR